MLRFDVYKNGELASGIDLAGAYVFGLDSIPVRADIVWRNGQIHCVKRTQGACGLAIMWDAGVSGRFLLSTARLGERKKPYNLNVELVRGKLAILRQKVEEWGLFDYASANSLLDELTIVNNKFIESLKADNPAEAAMIADEAMAQVVTLGEKMSLFHAQALLDRRRGNSEVIFGCRMDLFSMAGDYADKIKGICDFVNIPMPWKHSEPKEHKYKYTQIDSWVNWASRTKKPVHAGPLLSFEPNEIPDWLYIWEHDYDALRDMIYEHIQRVVKRYEKHVKVWNVVSGIHAHNHFNLTFDQLMELTRMSCLLVKKLAPHAQVMIDLAMPWGEYYAHNQRAIPPGLYADMVVQSGVKFDAFGIQTYMGVPVDGYYVRDLMQVSAMLDKFVSLSKTLHITACQVPSDITRDPWDGWGGQYSCSDAGTWHLPWSARMQAEWLQAFSRVALSKPHVETICWQDLADYEGHFISHGGLCKSNLDEKLAYKELRNFRAFIAAKP